jgi:aryl-alcohol dehydrogenase-like predicted oxidoreductase
MKRRILGGTGMSVSELALGTMMFGAYGNSDVVLATKFAINPEDNYQAAPPALEDKRLRRR